ncbi:MAG: hypothetical protein ABIR34_10345 [Marmoricola sp.]
MDLSAIIFVVLALAWAVYLIPKALKHHDEMASDRLVEGHSDKVRILSRHGKATRVDAPAEVVVESLEPTEKPVKPGKPGKPKVSRPAMSRAAARKAAQRRRRVLGVLVLALLVVWALTWLAYLRIWAPAVPGALVLGWLVLARLSVRRMTVARRPVARPLDQDINDDVVETAAPAPQNSQGLVDLLAEDTIGVPRQELEAAFAEDGSLWDPLPLTLPTYVNKARARRTVRTIELTGINSSGHDEADSTLARETRSEATKDAEPGSRKVAGA